MWFSDSRLINTSHKGLDSYHVVDTQSVEDTCCKDIEFQTDPPPNVTDALPLLSIYVETPKMDSTKCKVLREILPKFHINKL